MSQQAIKITIICEREIEKEIEKEIETALTNSGVQFNREEMKEPSEGYRINIPDSVQSLSVALHILEAKEDVVKGNIELSDGTRYELTQEGRNQLKEVLVFSMSKQRQAIVPHVWWTPFIPDIREQIIPELRETVKTINELIGWFPRASGEGKKIVTRNFLLLITGIIAVMFILTWLDKISGDAFVFVMGALVGYIFAFLERFLGILITREG